MRTHTKIQALAGRNRAERAYQDYRKQVRAEAARVAALTPAEAHDELMAACAAEDKALAHSLKGMK